MPGTSLSRGRHRLPVAVLLVVVCGCASTAPRLLPPGSLGTPAQNELVREGVLLHEVGEYNEAIERYRRVLAENPDHIAALYESGLTYFVSGAHADSLAMAERGAAFASPLRAEFLQLAGNAQDELNRPHRAVELYEAAIAERPDFALAYFNLAVTLSRQQRYAEARRRLVQSLSRNPQHASSHLLLAQLEHLDGNRATALLGYLRFLTLEGDGERAASVPPALAQLADEYALLDAAAAGGTTTPADPSFGAGRLRQIVIDLLDTAPTSDMTGPVAGQYLDWARAVRDAGHLETALHFALRSAPPPGTTDWLARHPNAVNDYLDWAEQRHL